MCVCVCVHYHTYYLFIQVNRYLDYFLFGGQL